MRFHTWPTRKQSPILGYILRANFPRHRGNLPFEVGGPGEAALYAPRRFSFRENKLPSIRSTLSRYIEQTTAIRRWSWVTTRRKIWREFVGAPTWKFSNYLRGHFNPLLLSLVSRNTRGNALLNRDSVASAPCKKADNVVLIRSLFFVSIIVS